jgi:hypothetical protein
MVRSQKHCTRMLMVISAFQGASNSQCAGVAVVFDLRKYNRLDRLLGVVVRQHLIRCVLYVRGLKALRPVSQYAAHVLLLVGVLVVARNLYRSKPTIPGHGEPIPLIGPCKGLVFCVICIHILGHRDQFIGCNSFCRCRYGTRAGVLLCDGICRRPGTYSAAAR